MTIAVIFVNLANHSQPVPSGLALVFDSRSNLDEIEVGIKEVSRNAQAQAGATVESILNAIKAAVEGKGSVAAFQIITVHTELFG